ncbi:MAG TPA: hypothetical protein VG028_02980 [Terriglobia bacterium]|nr:hypothetical protein [Terriglobia bacterium]
MASGFNPKSKIQNLKSLALVVICLAGNSAAQQAPAPARVTFTKVLEGSSPEFEEVAVDSTGAATYDGRKLSDPPSPRSITLSPATTQKVFALAHALNDFKSIDLESHKKVANLGRKTFTYEQGAVKNQAEFNYSLRREAQDLAELFERIATVEEHVKALEYDSKYDPLSLPNELLLIQIEFHDKAVAEPELLTPVLEQIVRNSHFLHLAQVRARDILQHIQSGN